MSDKMTRKELKAPDQFQKLGNEAVPLLVQHQKTIVIAVIAVVVLGLGISTTIWFKERTEAKASENLGAALEVVSREVSAAPPPITVGDDAKPPFKTEAEKNEALIKSVSEFRAAEKGTRAAGTAALPLGEALLREGKAPEALAAFDDYLKVSNADDPLRPLALEGKGYALEAKKDYDAALAAFDQLSKENKAEFMKGMGLYHRGRLLLLQGKTDEGVKQLQEVQVAAPGSSGARLAAERIAVLAGQGVKIPEQPKAAPAVDAGA